MISETLFAMLLVSPSLPAVESLSDLKAPIRYVDRKREAFFGVDGSHFRMGTALEVPWAASSDMSQIGGEIGDCSTAEVNCKSFLFLKLAAPVRGRNDRHLDIGVKVDLTPQKGGGFIAKAVCPRLTASGCIDRYEPAPPTITYQYAINRAGRVTWISIQYFDGFGGKVRDEDLRLESRLGINLAG